MTRQKDTPHCQGRLSGGAGKIQVYEAGQRTYPLCAGLYAENTIKIRSIKQYPRAALFNALSTNGSYHTSVVFHDMASGKLMPPKQKYTCCLMAGD